ncbi:hypothetical protein BT96DRAFT_1034748 [Gymnopus androsaceus JB14]|uniref:GroES-like protein n=1 Tax=Gymnopus androsaceus JB14 TaxID=1447944 RepID=A0A6A4HGP4_9AGAR|nr:hypothetical protein BT96DRAFT_1034748 [Gymnopus androsaceus JB14]
MSPIEIPKNIKAFQVQPDKTVELVEIPFAQQDLVRVGAVELNPTNCKVVIARVGSAVKHLKVGNHVAGFNYGGSFQTDNRSYAESSDYFKIQDEMSYDKGASLPIPHLTVAQVFPPSRREGDHPNLGWFYSYRSQCHTARQRSQSLCIFHCIDEDLKAIGAAKFFDYNFKAADVVKQIQAAAGERGTIYGLDTVGEQGTADSCIAAVSSTFVLILPPSKESQERGKDIKIEFCLVYTELGFDFTFANTFNFPAIPDDKVRALEYMEVYMPRVLEGWHGGKGSSTLKPQCLRRLGTGLEKIEHLKIMRDGEYGRENLVCAIY